MLNSGAQHPFNTLPNIHHNAGPWDGCTLNSGGVGRPPFLQGTWLKLRIWPNDASGGLAEWHGG